MVRIVREPNPTTPQLLRVSTSSATSSRSSPSLSASASGSTYAGPSPSRLFVKTVPSSKAVFVSPKSGSTKKRAVLGEREENIMPPQQTQRTPVGKGKPPSKSNPSSMSASRSSLTPRARQTTGPSHSPSHSHSNDLTGLSRFIATSPRNNLSTSTSSRFNIASSSPMPMPDMSFSAPGHTPYAPRPSMALQFNEDDSMLLDMRPPEMGFSSPTYDLTDGSDAGVEPGRSATRMRGGLMTPANSQEMNCGSPRRSQTIKRNIQSASLVRNPVSRLPTPPSSQPEASGSTSLHPPTPLVASSRTSRIRARPSPTPPRRVSTEPAQTVIQGDITAEWDTPLKLGDDVSPNPRKKKSPRLSQPGGTPTRLRSPFVQEDRVEIVLPTRRSVTPGAVPVEPPATVKAKAKGRSSVLRAPSVGLGRPTTSRKVSGGSRKSSGGSTSSKKASTPAPSKSRIIPSSAPAARRNTASLSASSARRSRTVTPSSSATTAAATKGRRASVPATLKTPQNRSRARKSVGMTPKDQALTGRKLGMLPRPIHGSPGDDPLLLLGAEDIPIPSGSGVRDRAGLGLSGLAASAPSSAAASARPLDQSTFGTSQAQASAVNDVRSSSPFNFAGGDGLTLIPLASGSGTMDYFDSGAAWSDDGSDVGDGVGEDTFIDVIKRRDDRSAQLTRLPSTVMEDQEAEDQETEDQEQDEAEMDVTGPQRDESPFLPPRELREQSTANQAELVGNLSTIEFAETVPLTIASVLESTLPYNADSPSPSSSPVQYEAPLADESIEGSADITQEMEASNWDISADTITQTNLSSPPELAEADSSELKPVQHGDDMDEATMMTQTADVHHEDRDASDELLDSTDAMDSGRSREVSLEIDTSKEEESINGLGDITIEAEEEEWNDSTDAEDEAEAEDEDEADGPETEAENSTPEQGCVEEAEVARDTLGQGRSRSMLLVAQELLEAITYSESASTAAAHLTATSVIHPELQPTTHKVDEHDLAAVDGYNPENEIEHDFSDDFSGENSMEQGPLSLLKVRVNDRSFDVTSEVVDDTALPPAAPAEVPTSPRTQQITSTSSAQVIRQSLSPIQAMLSLPSLVSTSPSPTSTSTSKVRSTTPLFSPPSSRYERAAPARRAPFVLLRYGAEAALAPVSATMPTFSSPEPSLTDGMRDVREMSGPRSPALSMTKILVENNEIPAEDIKEDVEPEAESEDAEEHDEILRAANAALRKLSTLNSPSPAPSSAPAPAHVVSPAFGTDEFTTAQEFSDAGRPASPAPVTLPKVRNEQDERLLETPLAKIEDQPNSPAHVFAAQEEEQASTETATTSVVAADDMESFGSGEQDAESFSGPSDEDEEASSNIGDVTVEADGSAWDLSTEDIGRPILDEDEGSVGPEQEEAELDEVQHRDDQGKLEQEYDEPLNDLLGVDDADCQPQSVGQGADQLTSEFEHEQEGESTASQGEQQPEERFTEGPSPQAALDRAVEPETQISPPPAEVPEKIVLRLVESGVIKLEPYSEDEDEDENEDGDGDEDEYAGGSARQRGDEQEENKEADSGEDVQDEGREPEPEAEFAHAVPSPRKITTPLRTRTQAAPVRREGTSSAIHPIHAATPTPTKSNSDIYPSLRSTTPLGSPTRSARTSTPASTSVTSTATSATPTTPQSHAPLFRYARAPRSSKLSHQILPSSSPEFAPTQSETKSVGREQGALAPFTHPVYDGSAHERLEAEQGEEQREAGEAGVQEDESEEVEDEAGDKSIVVRKPRRSLHDELVAADYDDAEDEGNESFRSVVEVSSLDPKAAARAAAILKLNHAYIEHGVLSRSAKLGGSSKATPKVQMQQSASSRTEMEKRELLHEAELEIVDSYRRSRSRSVSRPPHDLHSPLTLTGPSIDTGNDMEYSSGSRSGRGRSMSVMSFMTEDYPVPGGYVKTPRSKLGQTLTHAHSQSQSKRKRPISPLPPSRLSAQDDLIEPKGSKDKQEDSIPWGVPEWKRLEKVYRTERENWIKAREVKSLPLASASVTVGSPARFMPGGLVAWARRSTFGPSAPASPSSHAASSGSASAGRGKVAEWDSTRVVDRFLEDEKAHSWDREMLVLRVQAIERRVNHIKEKDLAASITSKTAESSTPAPKRSRRDAPQPHSRTHAQPQGPPSLQGAGMSFGDDSLVVQTPTAATSRAGHSAAEPPSTIRRMLGFVWGKTGRMGASSGSQKGQAPGQGLMAKFQEVDTQQSGKAAEKGKGREKVLPTVDMKEIRPPLSDWSFAPSPVTLPLARSNLPASSSGPAKPTSSRTKEKGLAVPATYPSSISESSSAPRQNLTSSRSYPIYASISHSALSSSPNFTSASISASTSLSRGDRLYPPLEPPMTQRSSAIARLFSSTSTPDLAGPTAQSSFNGNAPLVSGNSHTKRSGSVKDLVKNWEGK